MYEIVDFLVRAGDGSSALGEPGGCKEGCGGCCEGSWDWDGVYLPGAAASFLVKAALGHNGGNLAIFAGYFG